MITWDSIYNLLGIKNFIYFITSPGVQDMLFPMKLVFVAFAVFFFCAVMYFYINSSYVQYQFLQDIVEFFSWQPYGIREINKRWKKIMTKVDSGAESDYNLAIIEADDFLQQILDEKGYEGKTFEELINNAGRNILPNFQEILGFHNVRNSIVHNPNYKLELEEAKKILSVLEKAIKNASIR